MRVRKATVEDIAEVYAGLGERSEAYLRAVGSPLSVRRVDPAAILEAYDDRPRAAIIRIDGGRTSVLCAASMALPSTRRASVALAHEGIGSEPLEDAVLDALERRLLIDMAPRMLELELVDDSQAYAASFTDRGWSLAVRFPQDCRAFGIEMDRLILTKRCAQDSG